MWAHLVTRARREGATWTLACAGMALPTLASTVSWLTARYPGDPFDVQAEVLTGFLGAVASVDLDRPHVLARLRWAAYRAGITALFEALDAPTPLPPGYRSAPPRPPWGHPDLVLARAVREGVLTRTEADVIGATRLEDLPIGRWAADRPDITVPSAYKMRRRAERRLADYLRRGETPSESTDPVGEHVTTHLTSLTPTSTPPSEQPSPNVVALRRRTRSGQSKKVAGAVSKKGPDSGLFQCGRSTRPTGSRDLGGAPMRLIPHPRRRGPAPTRPTTPLTPTVRRGPRQAGRRGRRLLTIGTTVAVCLMIAWPAHAQPPVVVAAEDSLDAVLDNIRNWIMGIAATLATVMLSIGGVIRMMAGGDPGEIERSNRAFKSAAWGYGIAALAPLIVEILKGIVGE